MSKASIMLAHWIAKHKETTGQPYMVSWGKDQSIMKQICKTYNMVVITSMINLFFERMKTDDFLMKSGATVGIFKTQIPKLILDIKTHEEQKDKGRL